MSKDYDMSPAFGELDPSIELFALAGRRYTEASLQQYLHTDFVYLQTGTSEELGAPVGIFRLVNNFEEFSQNSGEILEVHVPLANVGDFSSGEESLSIFADSRKMLLKKVRPGHKNDKVLMVSAEGLTPVRGYPWPRHHKVRTPEYMSGIKHRLRDYKLVPARPADTHYESDDS